MEVARLVNRVMETDFGSRQTDELNSYVCQQLLILDEHLDRPVFIRILNVIYHHLLQSFLNLIEGEIQVANLWLLWLLIIDFPFFYVFICFFFIFD